MNHSSSDTISARARYTLLFVGGGVLLFAAGRHTIALAAWCALVFLLRFTRHSRRWFDWVILWLVLAGAWLFQFDGMAPLPWPGPLLIALASGLFGAIPFAIDRWLAPQLRGFSGTLLFPCALAAIDFSTRWSPYGSWGVWGYSQFGNLPLLQLVSVTGLYGLTFVLGWFASVVNRAWEHGWRWRELSIETTVFVAVVGGIYLVGAARVWGPRSHVPHVAMSGITADFEWKFPSSEAAQQFWTAKPLAEADLAAIRNAMNAQADQLLARTEREAMAGAQVVVWSECATWIWRTDEPSFVAKASRLARERGIYLAAAFASINPAHSNLHQNKIIFFGPDGQTLFEYNKSRPVPGAEQATTEVRSNPMFAADTPAGRMGAFICFDLDFPDLVRQAGLRQTDIVAVPAHDWLAIDPLHSQMAAFRAVENGFNLLRVAADGRSLAVDYTGRTLAEVDDFKNAGHCIRVQLPTRGTSTVYAKIGDAFGWLMFAGVAACLARGLRRGDKCVATG